MIAAARAGRTIDSGEILVTDLNVGSTPRPAPGGAEPSGRYRGGLAVPASSLTSLSAISSRTSWACRVHPVFR